MHTQRHHRPILRTGHLFALVAAVLAFPALAAAEGGSSPQVYGTFLALAPPLVAIVLALVTKEAYSSLFIGITVGALLYSGGDPVTALDAIISDGFVGAISGSAGIFMFLVLLGAIVALVNASGGSAAFGRWASSHVKGRVGAALSTFILGVLIFVDDYFNCLTVGSVMRPVTDSQRVSRAKLAYLIDATAAPICMIAPVSSWAAAVSQTAQDLNTGISGIELFVKAIPYNFYSLLTIVFIIALTVMKLDYGPMRTHELRAMDTGDLGAQETEDEEVPQNGHILDLILPVVVLVVFCIIGMIYVGGFWNGTSFVDAFSQTDASVSLPWGAIIALIFTVIYLVARRVLTFKEAMACIPKGFIAMVPPIIILSMAVSLKSMTNLLGADVYVHDLMEGAASGLYTMLPAVIFIVACLLAFASGTSWGTFSILIPIVCAIFDPASPLLIIGISACLAGAVCGDHCSPISDTTIMASAGAQCDHVTHVSTQLPYVVTVAAVSFVCFVLAGIIQNALICLAIGIVLTVAVLLAIRAREAKKASV